MSPSPALAHSYTAPAPLSCVPHGVAVSVSFLPPGLPAVILSSSVSDSAKSSALPPLHPLLASSLASWLSLSWRSIPSLLLLTWSWPNIPRSVSAVVLPRVVVVLLPVSTPPRIHPVVSPFLPPSPALLLTSYLGPLRPLAPSRAPLPPALAANIACRDEYVGDWTGGVLARWSVVGRSAPRSKIPSRPLAVVGDGKIRPQFLHRPQ